MEQTFKLGPLQTLWVKSLREHPERQGKNYLGFGTPEKYKACCLGELHMCYHRLNNLPLPFEEGSIIDKGENNNHGGVLGYSCFSYGLISSLGRSISILITINDIGYASLGQANDDGATWAEIADYIEAHPENIFTKSV